ncbi:MAG: protein kinase domain-containing protein [Acidimicrobiales bacterium]
MDRIADYQLLAALAANEHGRFFLARPPARLGRPEELVVVKVVGGSTEVAFRRFTRELQAFAAVASPYLVPVYDAGQQADTFFYAMEHAPLGTLAAPAEALDAAAARRALRHAALAAHALHEAGVAHRNITPAAVWLHPGGAKLADLGLAHLIEAGGSMTSLTTAGAVEWVDPALIRGDAPSRASDIYSLGAVLHFALTRRPIFGDLPTDNAAMAIRRVLREAPDLDPALEPADRALIAACLAPDPTDRPATAAQLADRLAEAGGA